MEYGSSWLQIYHESPETNYEDYINSKFTRTLHTAISI